MHPRAHAAANPEKPLLIMAGSGETLTYGALESRANQAAHLFRRLGLGTGDCLAVLMENNPAFFELVWGAQRAGLYYVCISTKLTQDEIAYILADSGAKALFASAAFSSAAAAVKAQRPDLPAFSVGGAIAGYEAYEPARAREADTPIQDESAGLDMLYSSGTTGRPKGVRAPLSGDAIDAPSPLTLMTSAVFGLSANTIYLSPAPLYHAAPLRWCMAVHRLGGTTVILEKFEPETYLAAIERFRANASQLVPTMFVRMLKLPAEARGRYDVSSLTMAVHAAAPCPIPIKEQMIAWWGPIIHEYYAGTEGNGFCTISAPEWLKKKGSVGKAILGAVRICDEEGRLLPPGLSGAIYFEGGPRFSYHNDDKRTAESQHPNEPTWSTLGDVGYVDEDGYLFLTDRKAFMIISGGVNIYPQEVENLLVTHPKVADAAVFGVPNEEFGEEVKAVIQPLRWDDTGPELEAELIAFARANLSHVKCPRSVDFMEELPRHPTGKLYKRLLRDTYWNGRDSKIV
ncbi:MAG: acyl-CoA synthetase [Alphaproteobacteria bacterium]|jgi:long-chain acyl-CoA synthetase|nr:acyl-CoA synthetase [Alphaproteobacteria bacterium]